MPKTRMIAISAIFGGLLFVLKVLPTPLDKMLIMFQAILLGLSSLLLGKMGATCTAAVGGLLTTVWRVGFAPFSLIFAVLYGLLVDGFFYVFKARTSKGDVTTVRLVASLTLSTATVGLLSTYITVSIGLMPMIPLIYSTILAVGILSGAVAGYLTSLLYKKYLLQYQKND